MSLLVTDENNKPVPAAVLGVAVVDDALLNLADDDTPRMTTHFLLTSEIEKPEDLEDADFYLGDDPKAAAALDLLLGTQGWRRFVEKSLEELPGGKKGPARRAARRLAADGWWPWAERPARRPCSTTCKRSRPSTGRVWPTIRPIGPTR